MLSLEVREKLLGDRSALDPVGLVSALPVGQADAVNQSFLEKSANPSGHNLQVRNSRDSPPTFDFQNGLVAWYPFDGNASDMSGNGNHGTVNGAVPSTDRFWDAGKAYEFDGVDDYILLPDNDLLELNATDQTIG